MKKSLVENSRKERQQNAQVTCLLTLRSRIDSATEVNRECQATWEFKRLEEERVAKRVQDIYIRDRQIVHQRYKQKHLALVQIAKGYDQVRKFQIFYKWKLP
jgi:hypothetical protein